MPIPRKPGPPPGPAKRSRYQTLIFDADRFFKENDFDTAYEIYQTALAEAPPGDNHIYAQLCRCYRKKARKALKKEDYTKVVELLTAMFKTNGERPNLKGMDYKVLAEACLELGQLDEAREALQKALDLEPNLQVEIANLQKRIKTEMLHNQLKNLY